MKTFIVIALIALSTTVLAADRFTLVVDGQAKAQIVTGENPPEPVLFAAKELQTFIKKMSGAELPITAQPVGGTPSIRLGPSARAKLNFLGLPSSLLKEIKRDGYVITIRKGDLCIVGIDDAGPQTDIDALLKQGITHDVTAWMFNRGTLYGVYRFLEELGMRWYLPGEFGERVPNLKTLTFSGEIKENPHFISRTVGYWSLWIGNNFDKNYKDITVMPGERAEIGFTPAENRMWELRMRGATFQIPLNHYPTSTRWVERFGKTHPEYFAMYPGGIRDNVNPHEGHLCYTCPGVAEESVADIQAFAAGKDSEARGISRIHPITKRTMNDGNKGWPEHIAFGDFFSLLPHDGFRPCSCPECVKLISSSGVKGEEHSKLVWSYINRCAERISGKMALTCLAYGSYSRPYPGMQKLPPNVTVGFCAYSHPASLYYKDDFERYEKLVAQWASLTHGNLAYWQHYLASNRTEENIGMPEHTPEMYARCIRIMARHGNHVFCEMMASSIMFELFNRYMLLKMFYNPALDERAIFDDFILGFYGPDAGPIIGEIYTDIGKKSVERFRNRYAGYSFWEKLFNEKTMRDYQARTDLALKKVVGTPYEKAVSAFKKYYLGLMEQGRSRYADPLAQLLASFNPELFCCQVKVPIVVDGKLDEPIWKSAVSVTMGNTVNGKNTANLTEVRTCHDSQQVYFAISAVDPGVGMRAIQNGGPGTVDSIEIYLDVPHNHQGYYRVGIDLTGKTYDYHYIDHIELGRPDWRSKAVTAVTRGESNYLMEVAIPFTSLTAPTGSLAGVEWGVLVGRTEIQAANTNDRQSSTSLLLRNKFEQANYFNHLKFTDK